MTDQKVVEMVDATAETFDAVRQSVEATKRDIADALDVLDACLAACDVVLSGARDAYANGYDADGIDLLYKRARDASGALGRAAFVLESTCEKNLEVHRDDAWHCTDQLANAARLLEEGAL